MCYIVLLSGSIMLGPARFFYTSTYLVRDKKIMTTYIIYIYELEESSKDSPRIEICIKDNLSYIAGLDRPK